MIYMDRPPSRAILIHHMIGIGYPGYPKGSLPPWSQLVGTLWRSSQYKNKAAFLVGIGSRRSWEWGHLLVGQRETLPEHLNVGSGVIEVWGSAGIVLEIWREGRLSSCGDHGGKEAMGLMNHGVQGQHNARNLFHPCPGGRTIKQASSEHIITGPMAPLVDGVALRVVGGGQQPLHSQRAHQLPPDLAHKLSTPVGQEAAGSAKIRHDMAKESVAHRVRRVIASRHQDCIPGVANDEHNEELMSAIGR